MNNQSTVNAREIDKFARHATQWWDKNGPLKTLHDINHTRLDYIKQLLPLSGLNVLDVGCGGGILCEAMANSGAQVTGIDAEQEAIEAAREHAAANRLSVQYQCTPIETYDNPCFDAVTCMEMLEHVEHPELVLQHCRRLLKPGGILFLSTINRTLKAYACAIFAAEYLLGLLPRQTHDYDKFIKPSELLAAARACGFNLVNMSGLSYNPILRTSSLSTDVQINYLLALQ